MSKSSKKRAQAQAPAQAPAPATTVEAPATPAPATTPTVKSAKYAKVDWAGTSVITLNPSPKYIKRGESLKRFNCYKNGITVDEYVAAVVAINQTKALAKADLRWDVAHGLISIAAPATA